MTQGDKIVIGYGECLCNTYKHEKKAVDEEPCDECSITCVLYEPKGGYEMFIKHEEAPVKKVFEKKIGIKSYGRIVFYKAAIRDLKCDYINLVFDAETNQIRIKPAHCPEGAFKIQGTSTKFITATQFFKYFGINPEGRFGYAIEDEMLVVQLTESEEPKGGYKMNSELNEKFEELTKTLEKIGFKELSINIYQHDCTEEQAKRLGEAVDKAAEYKTYHDSDESTYWIEAELRSCSNLIKFCCFYTPDKEASNDPSNPT